MDPAAEAGQRGLITTDRPPEIVEPTVRPLPLVTPFVSRRLSRSRMSGSPVRASRSQPLALCLDELFDQFRRDDVFLFRVVLSPAAPEVRVL